MAGERRCGARERDMWAVTTKTDAIPRRPWVPLISGGHQVVGLGHGCSHTSAQTTSRFPFPDMILLLCTIFRRPSNYVRSTMTDQRRISKRSKEKRSNVRRFST